MNNSKHRLPVSILLIFILFPLFIFAGDWYRQDSPHFTCIYRNTHKIHVPHILEAAEKAYATLAPIFDYQLSQKIIINTYDYSDYGKAGTTTLPQNFIRLEIEPLELSYETMPFNERFQWIISHELVHVIVNDKASRMEKTFRRVFSKVPPEADQPLTVFYSYLTNYQRYTPRWHQEGIAIFLETWLSGGYGRVLGNFDEMYFRSMVEEGRRFPDPEVLEAYTSHNSFLLETLFYLYGSRFCSWLAKTYGVDSLIEWFDTQPDDFYSNFKDKFRGIFHLEMDDAWQRFLDEEKTFQKENLQRLAAAPFTPVDSLFPESVGWVTTAYYEPNHNSVLFAYHRPHHLTALVRLNLNTHHMTQIGSIPSPSMIEIASTAYDPVGQLFFYTTNNNKLFRDVHVLSTHDLKGKVLFPDSRLGQMSISPATRELWAVRHAGGQAELVVSPYPYAELFPLINFGNDASLQHLSVSPDGQYLSATLHRGNGRQSIIMADLNVLRQGGKFTFVEISSGGAPEHPCWSPDGKFIFWNASLNGVSNIYRYDRNRQVTEALSHSLRGLFRPLAISADSLFAFEFTSQGFRPCIIKNEPAQRLTAIQYYGQQVIGKNPQVTGWAVSLQKADDPPDTTERSYRAFKNIHVHSFIPVISGFQSQKVAGIFTHLADPLYIHDLSIETGFTPVRPNAVAPVFHFRGVYQYKRIVKLGFEHNASNFYDLFNQRKQGMIGNRSTLAYTKYWKYDIPHKIKQVSEIALYYGIEAINDNLVRVSRPDFIVAQSALTSSNTRRSIGSSDAEQGYQWGITGMFFGVEPRRVTVVGGFHSEASWFSTWLVPHNVLHLKLSAGYRHTKDYLAIGKFYFGGFGNRYLEKANARQYRKVFRFPGIPIYSLTANRFVKGMLEHDLPPLRFKKAALGSHYISHINTAWYAQGLLPGDRLDDGWLSLGAQIDVHLKHWYNLDSALSFGAARAWNKDGSSDEWFISLKLLRN